MPTLTNDRYAPGLSGRSARASHVIQLSSSLFGLTSDRNSPTSPFRSLTTAVPRQKSRNSLTLSGLIFQWISTMTIAPLLTSGAWILLIAFAASRMPCRELRSATPPRYRSSPRGFCRKPNQRTSYAGHALLACLQALYRHNLNLDNLVAEGCPACLCASHGQVFVGWWLKLSYAVDSSAYTTPQSTFRFSSETRI